MTANGRRKTDPLPLVVDLAIDVARDNAHREAVDACIAVFLRHFGSAWGGVECASEMRALRKAKP